MDRATSKGNLNPQKYIKIKNVPLMLNNVFERLIIDYSKINTLCFHSFLSQYLDIPFHHFHTDFKNVAVEFSSTNPQ